MLPPPASLMPYFYFMYFLHIYIYLISSPPSPLGSGSVERCPRPPSIPVTLSLHIKPGMPPPLFSPFFFTFPRTLPCGVGFASGFFQQRRESPRRLLHLHLSLPPRMIFFGGVGVRHPSESWTCPTRRAGLDLRGLFQPWWFCGGAGA